MQSINRLNACTSIHSLTTHSRRHTDLQGSELGEGCQARRDGAFQIVATEIPIGGEEQKVEGGAVDGCSVMSIGRSRLTTHTKRLPTHSKMMAHVSLTLLLWLQRALVSTAVLMESV